MFVFIDYASIDGNLRPDWDRLRNAVSGVGSRLAGVIFRGAWGLYADPVLQRDWKSAQAAGLITGAYLYLRTADQRLDPEAQVKVFADNLGPITGHDLVPAIDVEDTGMDAEAELAWIQRAWRAMYSIYGAPPMIYTSARVWSEDVHDLSTRDLLTSPLWLAKPWPWKERRPAQFSPVPFQPVAPGAPGAYDPMVPKPWKPGNWWMHQYQGDANMVPGFTSTIDISRFNPMGQGERGERVRWVQARIGAAQDAVFGPKTADALRQFQTAHGLVADAIVGPQTFVALMWARAAA